MTKGLYSVKPWFVSRLRRTEDALVRRRVSPNTLTVAAVAVSVLAGAAVALGGLTHHVSWWFLVPPLAIVRLALNALDGAIARRTQQATSSGAVLNELGDRASDTAMMAPAALVAAPALALGAVAAAYLTSLTGVLGLALTGTRLQGGPMGKADRVVVVALATLAAAALGSGVAITVGLCVIGAGCAVTVALRVRSLIELSSRSGPNV
jgi:CDP-diacylglycerol---glycerol-3-phosphate 3-phosphatidyltransferase